jgi:Glycosyltransferase family 87
MSSKSTVAEPTHGNWPGHDLRWLNPERGRLYSAASLILSIGFVVCLLRNLRGGYFATGLPFGTDFTCFWAASRLIRAGLAADVYVPALQKLAALMVVAPAHYAPFFYPPPFLLFCAPLATLPFFWALAAFMAATGAIFAVAVYRAAASPWVAIAALGCPAVLVNLIAGQNAMLTAAILGGGLTLMRRQPRLAGLILGLMVIKPHLALAVPIALVVSRRWTVLGFAALSASALIALSTGLFGWGVWHGFIANLATGRRVLEDGLVPFSKFLSAFALARMLGAGLAAAYAVQCLSAGAALGVMIRAQMRRASPGVECALIVLASLLITPYLLLSDIVILVFPLAWLLADWAREGFPPWSKVLLLLGYLLPVLNLAYSPAHVCLFGMLGLVGYVARTTLAGVRIGRPSPVA